MPEPGDHVRAFVSIHLTPDVLDRVRSVQAGLRDLFGETVIRWTPAEQMHLTLKFLGRVPATALPELQSALQGISTGFPAMTLRATGVGAFPSVRRPRVLWVGVRGDIELLGSFQKSVESVTAPWAEKEENRGFQPHLTLGRVRPESRLPAHTSSWLAERNELVCGQWEATEYHLMQSCLSPRGAVHDVLASFPLAGH